MDSKSDNLKLGKDYIGVGCGVFVHNDSGEILLLKRSKNCKNDVGYWERPGGTVEFGEKVTDALKRETLEEVGVEIEDIEFLGFTDHFIPEEDQHWLGLSFMAEIKSGEPKNIEPEKHDAMKWFKDDKMPDNLALPTKESLPLMIKRYKEKYKK